MKWLTKEEIISMDPLDASILHWEQIRDAGAKEFYEAKTARLVDIGRNWCGLCIRYFPNCLLCPLSECSVYDSPYSNVVDQMRLCVHDEEWSKAAIERFNVLIGKLNQIKELKK